MPSRSVTALMAGHTPGRSNAKRPRTLMVRIPTVWSTPPPADGSVTESEGIGDSSLAGGRGSRRATTVATYERHGSPGGSPSQGFRRKCHGPASEPERPLPLPRLSGPDRVTRRCRGHGGQHRPLLGVVTPAPPLTDNTGASRRSFRCAKRAGRMVSRA